MRLTKKFFTNVSHKKETDWLYSSSINRKTNRYIRSCAKQHRPSSPDRHSLRVDVSSFSLHCSEDASVLRTLRRALHNKRGSPFAVCVRSSPTPASGLGWLHPPQPGRCNPAAPVLLGPPRTATCMQEVSIAVFSTMIWAPSQCSVENVCRNYALEIFRSYPAGVCNKGLIVPVCHPEHEVHINGENRREEVLDDSSSVCEGPAEATFRYDQSHDRAMPLCTCGRSNAAPGSWMCLIGYDVWLHETSPGGSQYCYVPPSSAVGRSYQLWVANGQTMRDIVKRGRRQHAVAEGG